MSNPQFRSAAGAAAEAMRRILVENARRGLLNLGSFNIDMLVMIFANKVSTSHDDVFDPFT